MSARDQAAACPNCGAPVVTGRCSSATCQNHNGVAAFIRSLPDEPDDSDRTIEVNDGFGI